MGIEFPQGFVALKKYPGYFWNTEEKKLYSMKVDGILKPLRQYVYTDVAARHMFRPRMFIGDKYYTIYQKSKRKTVIVHEIERYLDYDHVIPIRRNTT